jgi:hypothetical protein
LEALIVNAIGVSVGVEGLGSALTDDLEQEIIEPITIGSKKIIFFILIYYLLMITLSV